MSKDSDRVTELENYLKGQKNSPVIKKLAEYLTLVRAKSLEGLESANNEATRGRSKFCKVLLKLISE